MYYVKLKKLGRLVENSMVVIEKAAKKYQSSHFAKPKTKANIHIFIIKQLLVSLTMATW